MSLELHFIDVIDLVSKEVKGLWRKIIFHIRSWFRDEWYKPIPIDELHAWLEVWKGNVLPKLAYTPETFDCDDFGAYFKAWLVRQSGKNCVGEAIGIVHVPDVGDVMHEWNIVLAKMHTGKVMVLYVEPQIGQVLKEHSYDGWKYNLMWVIM
ncbi:MAG: hypothetical protein DRO23_07005 [Thermoprotei archaeon]|nr:MAG: hypothetical protein DRO23_07005 [Thermoprotei archaeon]